MTAQPAVGWALCQNGRCPTHTPHAQHHIKVEVYPWSRLVPERCPECNSELKLDLIYGVVPQPEPEEQPPTQDSLF